MTSDPHLDALHVESRLEHLMAEIRPSATAVIERPLAPLLLGWRPRPRLVFAVAIAVAVATGAVTGLLGDPTAKTGTAFAVEPTPTGDTAVAVVNTEVAAAAMTSQLHAAGINVTVATMTASPQLVGMWVAASFASSVSSAASAAISEQTDGYVSTIDIPRSLRGGVTLTVGVAPAPGKAPDVVGQPNALAPGGLAGCLALSGTTPSVAASALQAKGYQIVWKTSLTSTHTVPEAPAGDLVAAAFVSDTSPAVATLLVNAPNDPRYVHQLQLGYPLDQRTTTGVQFLGCKQSG